MSSEAASSGCAERIVTGWPDLVGTVLGGRGTWRWPLDFGSLEVLSGYHTHRWGQAAQYGVPMPSRRPSTGPPRAPKKSQIRHLVFVAARRNQGQPPATRTRLETYESHNEPGADTR